MLDHRAHALPLQCLEQRGHVGRVVDHARVARRGALNRRPHPGARLLGLRLRREQLLERGRRLRRAAPVRRLWRLHARPARAHDGEANVLVAVEQDRAELARRLVGVGDAERHLLANQLRAQRLACSPRKRRVRRAAVADARRGEVRERQLLLGGRPAARVEPHDHHRVAREHRLDDPLHHVDRSTDARLAGELRVASSTSF